MKRLMLLSALALALSPFCEARAWKNTEGKEITADYVSSNGTTVIVKMPNGREFSIPLNSLSQEDQDFVAQQVAAGDKEDSGEDVDADGEDASVSAEKANANLAKLAEEWGGKPVAGNVVPKAGEGKAPSYDMRKKLGRFKQHIGGVCVDDKDNVIISGDKAVITYDSNGKQVSRFTVPDGAGCVAVGEKDTIWVATMKAPFSVVQYDRSGKELTRFKLEMEGKPVTGLGAYKDNVLVAHANPGTIICYKDGKKDHEIGRAEGAARGLSTCCGILDFCVDKDGYVHVAELGGHRVSIFTVDGKRVGSWGKQGKNAENFDGCCNPVSIAYLGNGIFATAEKEVPKIKIFSGDEKVVKMVTDIADVARGCGNLNLAADSKGRIYAVNEVAKHVFIVQDKASK